MMVATYLRRGRRTVERMLLHPVLRSWAAVLSYGGAGFVLSAAGLSGSAQPVAVGLICAGTGWRALLMALGAMVGYPTFWGSGGKQGIVWSASAGMLALLLGKREESREQPLMIPAIGAFLTAVTGIVFALLLREGEPLAVFALRIPVAFCAGVLFTQAKRQRDAMTDWLIGGVLTWALAMLSPLPWLNPGFAAAGFAGISGGFPAAAVAGLGLDLAGVTALPMTAVMSVTWLLREIPFDKKWQHYASPGFACLVVAAVCGIRDISPLPGLLAGGSLAALLPPTPQAPRRRGETGMAQVRLELGAEVMGETAQVLTQLQPPPVDTDALFHRAVDRACGSCSARKTCQEREKLTPELLKEPSDGMCRKPGKLQAELFRARDQLRGLQRERQRLGEYRDALHQQYVFLEAYLRTLADRLPRSSPKRQAVYRVEAAARSRGKERANGDRCMAFSGPDCRYYLLLCDGMGTGLAAAREGEAAAGQLRRLLNAGFPPEHALRTLNSLLILRGAGGAVSVDLAEVCLDTGLVRLHKWGASPSWLLHRSGPEKIGTASPPPGISLEGMPEKTQKLSLCRGEPLILLSDGVDGEDVLHRLELPPDAPPGELAAEILEKSRGQEDDATAAVVRLCPAGLATS